MTKPREKTREELTAEIAMRPLDERGAWAAKSQKEYDLDENGERIRLPSGRYIHFSETSRETFTDKVVRLIQNDSGDETA